MIIKTDPQETRQHTTLSQQTHNNTLLLHFATFYAVFHLNVFLFQFVLPLLQYHGLFQPFCFQPLHVSLSHDVVVKSAQGVYSLQHICCQSNSTALVKNGGVQGRVLKIQRKFAAITIAKLGNAITEANLGVAVQARVHESFIVMSDGGVEDIGEPHCCFHCKTIVGR